MCGIAGIISLSGRPIANAQARIEQMNALLHHRGPDGRGVFVSPDCRVALGNTRLAITDPGMSLQLPFRSPDEDAVLTFNGEIYDYREHRGKLAAGGVHFRTKTDTEVLLAGLRASGEDFLHHIDGMWAFAYFDASASQVTLSRDLLGERHIFYRADQDEFIFASEPLAILADRAQPEDIDWQGLVTALRYNTPSPGQTLVSGLHRMLAGHNLRIDVGQGWTEYSHRRLHPEKWFDFFHSEPDIGAVGEQFEDLMHRVSMRRLPPDVDYLSTLSGGIDSTLVCLFASDFGRKPLKTLYGQSTAEQVAVPPGELDEYAASCLTSGKLNTQHRHVQLNEEDCVPILRRIAANAFDGMIDPGVAPFEMLARRGALAQNHKVMLISDGPDETAGGYGPDRRAYQLDKLRRRHPLRFALLSAVGGSRVGRRLMRRTGHGRDIIPADISYAPFHFRPGHHTAEPDYFSKLVDERSIQAAELHYGAAPSDYGDILGQLDETQIRALSYAQYSLPDMFNLRTDRAFMRASVECRLPFEAPEMVEFLIAMPAPLRFGDNGETKVMLRNVVARHIGPEVGYRSKQGFATPLHGTPEVRSRLQIEEVIADSSMFEDLPFRRGARERILQDRSSKILWAFYALALTQGQLRTGRYDAVSAEL
jgi:asparagine synthase (glutamine-hydrolysing)